jgi:hypothetical protein
MVINGDFSEGWRLPWEVLWQFEGMLVILYAAGAAAAVAQLWRLPQRAWLIDRRLLWLVLVLLIYAGLAAGSTLLERFTVYDRLARQMFPFICLSAAAGIASLSAGAFVPAARFRFIVTVCATIFVFNAAPLATLTFPEPLSWTPSTRMVSTTSVSSAMC